MQTALRVSMGALAAAALFAAAGNASAARLSDRRPSVALHYTVSDLSTDSRIRSLYARIVRTAEQVCPPYIEGGLGFREEQRIADTCRRQAVARAIRQIGSPALAAVAKRTVHVG